MSSGRPIYYAHSREDDQGRLPEDAWELLADHLMAVGHRAGRFAAVFGAEALGRLAGLLHDLGKADPAFQARLRGGPRVDHSTAGAKYVAAHFGPLGSLLAYVIAGHHTGLADWNGSGGLKDRLADPGRGGFDSAAVPKLPNLPEELPISRRLRGTQQRFALSFLTRMLFSALVDADFLETERFYDPARAQARRGWPVLGTLSARLDAYLARFPDSTDPVMAARAAVLGWCRDAALRPPGFFRLTVPTGGGKTLSSLAFALAHCQAHGLGRVVYAIPYTSITEQTALVFRDALGDDAVLEHHSAYDPSPRPDNTSDFEARRDFEHRAAENWDAPVIVTTTVQLLESLFANRPGRCRKLHRLARAVIVLDEAQLLPVPFLRPVLEALQALVRDYGATVVLCTATQPAFQVSHFLENGIPETAITDIVPPADSDGLFAQLERVTVSKVGTLADPLLADRLGSEAQVLCIVDSRRHAHDLFGLIADGPGSYHLSARMTPAHRSDMLAQIRRALADGEPCRVVSTQVIEAGVHVDFPVVYRAMAGLDSIAQAAGRCNREGKRACGTVYVFTPENHTPRGVFSRRAAAASAVMSSRDDWLSPETQTQYFRTWYTTENHDSENILSMLSACHDKFEFSRAAAAFKIIDSPTIDLLVPWGADGQKQIDALGHAPPHRAGLRRLQRHTIGIYEDEWCHLVAQGAVRCIADRFWILNEMDRYCPRRGLRFDHHPDFDAPRYIL